MPSDSETEQSCKSCLAEMLDIDESEILPSTTFASLGLDSAAAVHFILEMEQRIGIELYPGVTHDYPTVAEFAAYLGQRLGPS
jgi:acyl carrier protein